MGGSIQAGTAAQILRELLQPFLGRELPCCGQLLRLHALLDEGIDDLPVWSRKPLDWFKRIGASESAAEEAAVMKAQLTPSQVSTAVVQRGVQSSGSAEAGFYYVGGGGIALPARRVFQPGLTVTAAIKACGGFTANAIKQKTELTHAGNAPLVINIADIEQGIAPDPEVKSGDRLWVPAPPPRNGD